MSETDMDVVRDFRRGAVRLHVLHHASERRVSGAWLAAELAEHGYRISPGTRYPLLHDLEAAGLLVSTAHVEGGHVTRSYEATEGGRATLSDAREALSELAAELLSGKGARRAKSDVKPVGQGRSVSSDREARRLSRAVSDELNSVIARLRSDEVRRVGGTRTAARSQAAAEVLGGLRMLLEEVGW